MENTIRYFPYSLFFDRSSPLFPKSRSCKDGERFSQQDWLLQQCCLASQCCPRYHLWFRRSIGSIGRDKNFGKILICVIKISNRDKTIIVIKAKLMLRIKVLKMITLEKWKIFRCNTSWSFSQSSEAVSIFQSSSISWAQIKLALN